MLAATSSAPNSQPHAVHRPAPVPANWRGVAASMQQAREAFQHQSHAEAERLLLELLEFAPAETQAWKLLARVQKALGQINSAIASATRALELQNAASQHEQMPASITLARLLWEQEEFDSARAMLGILLMREPDNNELAELKKLWQQEVSA